MQGKCMCRARATDPNSCYDFRIWSEQDQSNYAANSFRFVADSLVRKVSFVSDDENELFATKKNICFRIDNSAAIINDLTSIRRN